MNHMASQPNTDSPGGLLFLANDGTITQAPKFFRRILFLDQRDTTPSIFELFDANQPPYLELHRIFRHPYGATEFHLHVKGQFGTRHGFRYWSVAAPDDQRLGTAAFFIVDDSALLQNHAWDFRRLRRNILSDTKDSLSSYFKNRLATVQLLAETLRDAPDIAAESAPRLVTAVEELSNALNQVITGINDIESTNQYHDSPIRLSDLDAVINMWATPQICIDCSLDNVSPATLIPASSIERIVLPVLENARDSPPPNSTIEIKISEVDEGFAHFEIIDQGEGMSERVRQRAGDPFFTTRTGQLGLGLAHAREALRDAGGEWTIESAPRRGTRVTILLPITTSSQIFQ